MSERRDYSQVTWPWDDDPHWDAPREGATSDAGDNDNWRLACSDCALYFPLDITVGVMADHWTTLHHPEQADDPQPELNLVWVGLGAPPQPPEGVMG